MASKKQKTESAEAAQPTGQPTEEERDAARAHLQTLGRNEACWCKSGKKYKKCHLPADEQLGARPPAEPDAAELIARGWRLFEQRRPGAAEREFRAALAKDASNADAQVGIGMAKLQSGEAEGARTELEKAVGMSDAVADKMKKEKVKDAFMRPEAQAYVRACHALGCLAFDQNRYEDTVKDLARVYSIDEGTVGTEARLVAAKAYTKLEKPEEALKVLEPALASEHGGTRAKMGSALAHFLAGRRNEAKKSLEEAIAENQHLGRAVLGKLKKNVETVAGALPGSLEEAAIYAQTYGDVWTPEAKAFVAEWQESHAAKAAPGSPATATP